MPAARTTLPCILVCIIGWLLTQPGHAFDFRTPIDLHCRAGETGLLHCGYRLLRAGRETHSTVYWQGEAAAPVQRQSWPWPGARTAVLFVIDTSRPERQAGIRLGKQHIAQLLEAARPHHLAGLASLGRELRLHAPVGSSRAVLLQGLQTMEAGGATAELYRNTLVAIDMLAVTGAERRLLFLFSDGQADDRAYFHRDVVDKARQNGVVINSLGYPRAAQLSATLQILRRMSEETSGLYQESPGQALSARQLEEALTAIDSGGRFAIPLDALHWPDDGGPGVLQLRVQTAYGVLETRAQVARPAEAEDPPAPGAPAPEAPAVPVAETGVAETAAADGTAPDARTAADGTDAAPTLQGAPAAPAPDTRTGRKWRPGAWYGLAAAGILLLAVLLYARSVQHRARRKQGPARPSAPKSAPKKPAPASFSFAYLLRRDQPGARHPITRAIWHIGRGRDNDLRIDDSTVSRRHAVLRLQENGEFDIIDLQSSNGTFVNEQRVTQHGLRENDIVGMGRAMFYYTHRSDEDEQDYLTDAMRPV